MGLVIIFLHVVELDREISWSLHFLPIVGPLVLVVDNKGNLEEEKKSKKLSEGRRAIRLRQTRRGRDEERMAYILAAAFSIYHQFTHP